VTNVVLALGVYRLHCAEAKRFVQSPEFQQALLAFASAQS
jgi:hypothetical protein